MIVIISNSLIFGTGASAAKDYEGLNRVVSCALGNGIRIYDTAPSYGVEEILSRIIFATILKYGLKREEICFQTKIDGWQMMDGNIEKFVDDALRKMNLQYLDNLLIHWPFPDYLENTWKAFKKMKECGKVRKIGICNVRLRHLKTYEEQGIFPEIIQIERNPLRTCEREIAFCKQHNVEVQAYSPLCKMDKRLSESHVLKTIADKHAKNIGQIILRWHIDTGVIPIFTSTKEERILEYTKLFDFSLSKEEIAEISSLNVNYKIYLESCYCPGF